MAAFTWLLIAAAAHTRPPDLLSLVPTSGPVEGGTRLTLTGAGLSGDFSLVCRFGQGQRSQVPGTFEGLSSHGRVYCSAPPAHAGYEVLVELSLDGGGSYVGKHFSFTYFHEVTVSAISPNSGPAAGATLVRVSGYNFSPTAGLSCLFGWRLAAATYVDFQTVSCAAPQHAANSSVRLSFEDASLGMELDDAAVGATAELAGEVAAAEGVLWIGAVPNGAARGYAGTGSEAGLAVRAGCGLLALRQPQGTSAPAQGFSAQFALLMRGGATGLTFSYGGGGEAGELWEGGRTGWGVEGVATGLAVRFWGETSTHFRPYSIEVVMHGALLERAVLGRALLLSGTWAEVSLRLDPISHELSVSYDGTVHLVTILASFAPVATDRFYLSGCMPPILNATATPVTSTGVLLDDLVISASSLLNTRTEQLHVRPPYIYIPRLGASLAWPTRSPVYVYPVPPLPLPLPHTHRVSTHGARLAPHHPPPPLPLTRPGLSQRRLTLAFRLRLLRRLCLPRAAAPRRPLPLLRPCGGRDTRTAERHPLRYGRRHALPLRHERRASFARRRRRRRRRGSARAVGSAWLARGPLRRSRRSRPLWRDSRASHTRRRHRRSRATLSHTATMGWRGTHGGDAQRPGPHT